jgi:hypothetical protein
MNIPKGVAIALGILVILSIILISNKNEGFAVVEDDTEKIITIQENSLLDKINQKE